MRIEQPLRLMYVLALALTLGSMTASAAPTGNTVVHPAAAAAPQGDAELAWQSFLGAGQLAPALKLAQAMVTREPHSALWHRRLGSVAEQQGNAVLATLANTVNNSSAAYGDTITNLNSMLQTWQPNTEEFTKLLTRLPEFGDAINRTSSYGGFVSLYLCNFTLKIRSHEANIFGYTHSEVCQ